MGHLAQLQQLQEGLGHQALKQEGVGHQALQQDDVGHLALLQEGVEHLAQQQYGWQVEAGPPGQLQEGHLVQLQTSVEAGPQAPRDPEVCKTLEPQVDGQVE